MSMRLLVECARARPDDAAIRRAAAAVDDWNQLLEQADRHGMAPLLCWYLERCPDVVPAAVLGCLRDRLHAGAAYSLKLAAELVRLVALFDRAGIEVVPFKGPAIAWSLYDSPALRQMTDLDLLVRPAEAPRAVDLLVASGCRPAYSADLRFFRPGRELPLSSPAGVAIDLHWALAPSQFCHALDLDRFRSRLVTVSIAGGPIRTLAPEDLLIFLCVHGAKHYWCSLNWLCDLTRLIDRTALDWDALMAYSRARRATRIVSAGLLLAADVLGAAVPPAILAGARACPRTSRIASRAQLWLRDHPAPQVPKSLEFRFQLSLLERPSDKLRLCWGTLAPCPADLESLALPRPLFPVYYALRPLRLMAKYSGLAARRIFS
jgi:hypothetical protein